jgi:hypothetical protein
MRGDVTGRIAPGINVPIGMKFEIIGELRSVETIAAGRQIRVLASLRKKWAPDDGVR